MVEAKQRLLPLLGAGQLWPREIRDRCARATKGTRTQLRESGKIIEGTYYSRPHVEDPILAWPASSFPVLGIRAPGGAGKSTLADHLAGKWEAAGHAVVLLRATTHGVTKLVGSLMRKPPFGRHRHRGRVLCPDAGP